MGFIRNIIPISLFTVSALVAAQPVQALENSMTAEFTATSTYLWRGVALSADAALQASLVLTDPSGIHADFFTSNVVGGSETQIAAGFKGFLNQFKYDAGGRFYYLPQFDSSNFVEVYFGISGDRFGGKVSISPDSGTYVEGYASLPALEKWDLLLSVGQYMVDENDRGETIPADDYTNFSAALTTLLDGYNFEIKISGNTLKENEALLSTDNFRTVVSVSRKFTP